MLLVTCVILSFINHAILEDGNVHTSSHILWEDKLHLHLLSNYRNVEYIQGSKPREPNRTVSVRFLLKTFKFFNDDKDFKIYTWMFTSWNDTALEWNPADFDGIDSTHLDPWMVWAPEMTVDNDEAMHADVPPQYFVKRCQFYSHGKVNCVTPISHTVLCQSKLSNWPYDIQTCRLNYTSKQPIQKGSSRGISTYGAEYGTNWNIIASNYTLDRTKSKITLTFVVERLALDLAIMYVIPLFVIVLLNFTAIAIDFESKYRIYILCFCLLSHFIFMQEINTVIPLNGYETPKILIFLRVSLVLSALSIVITFTLMNLCRKSSSPPVLIFKFNKLFYDSSRKFLLRSKWMIDSARLSPEDTTENWKVFSHVLNFINVCVYCIVYPVLFMFYIPRTLPNVE